MSLLEIVFIYKTPDFGIIMDLALPKVWRAAPICAELRDLAMQRLGSKGNIKTPPLAQTSIAGNFANFRIQKSPKMLRTQQPFAKTVRSI